MYIECVKKPVVFPHSTPDTCKMNWRGVNSTFLVAPTPLERQKDFRNKNFDLFDPLEGPSGQKCRFTEGIAMFFGAPGRTQVPQEIQTCKSVVLSK